MPRVEASVEIDVPRSIAFAVSQTTGDVRLRWDPFIAEQHHLDGATHAGKGVRTRTRSRHGLVMISEYASFHPPARVGMRMVEGPWFFERFGGGWVFEAVTPTRTKAIWRYTFTVKPAFLAPIADRIGIRVLSRDIRRRIDAFAAGCEDEVVVDAARALAERWRAAESPAVAADDGGDEPLG